MARLPGVNETAETADTDDDASLEVEVAPVGRGHVELRTVVLPGRKILFVPNLKAGCTSLLWMLSELAGLRKRRFERSPLGAVTRAMTIHTMSAWPSRLRWSDRSAEEREAIITADSWLRFTTVRDPATRLWSAWQSKLLLREPGFFRRFGDRAWFPRIPSSPEEVVDDFRAFIRSLGDEDPPFDAHWAPQTDLLAASPSLTHVGRLEKFDETLLTIRAHVGPQWDTVAGADENKTPLRCHRGLYDAESVEIVNTYYAADFAELGYAPLSAGDGPALDDWIPTASVLMNAIASICRSHERIEDLHRQAKQADRYRAKIRDLRAENARLEACHEAVDRSAAD
jgi:hypothetical protein